MEVVCKVWQKTKEFSVWGLSHTFPNLTAPRLVFSKSASSMHTTGNLLVTKSITRRFVVQHSVSGNEQPPETQPVRVCTFLPDVRQLCSIHYGGQISSNSAYRLPLSKLSLHSSYTSAVSFDAVLGECSFQKYTAALNFSRHPSWGSHKNANVQKQSDWTLASV